MAKSVSPTVADIDLVFASEYDNPFSLCAKTTQDALRAILLRDREVLRLRVLSPQDFQEVEPGHLYCVLSGKADIKLTIPNDRSVIFDFCESGNVFGDLVCLPFSSMLRIQPSRWTASQSLQLLSFPSRTVVAARKIPEFERRLDHASPLDEQRVIMSLRTLKSELAIAHLCISSICGDAIEQHPTLRYFGSPITTIKRVVLEEFEQLAGLTTNAVRRSLNALSKRGYISTTTESRRNLGTKLEVLKPELLLMALGDLTLD